MAAPADRFAERRQLTVMFCDLVGSTSLSYQLDPEELREVVRSYQATCTRIIESFDGYVAQYLGDGILAYFGFPVALESEASRAVRAGLDIVHNVGELNTELHQAYGISLGVRVGLHTGLVVVGEIGAGQRREHLAMGDTPNLAARIQGYAEPNTVALSGDTYRLIQKEFQVRDLGTRLVSGIPNPIRIYAVVGEMAPSKMDVPESAGDDTVFGRELEMTALRERWTRALQEQGQVVVLTGDAGIGKSALVRSFLHELDLQSCTVLQARCLPYFRNTAYRPFLDLLKRRAQDEWSPLPPHTIDSLPSISPEVEDASSARETACVVATLLGAPAGSEEPEAATPQQKQDRIRSALLQVLLRIAAQRPLLLCVEDLQWADPSSLELLRLLADLARGRRILMVLTHRSEFHLPWNALPYQAVLSLGRLQPEHTTKIMARIACDKPLPPEVSSQIIRRTDGVPLFVEELTKMVLESGMLREEADRFELVGGSLPALAIPVTLHDSLEARLDRLADTKELAQMGSVLGREFSYGLLRAVTGRDDDVLRNALARLIEAELLFESGTPPNATYTFKHALVQETAYQSLLKGARQVYHLRVAKVLEEQFADEAAAHPELIAQHFAAAGQAARAIEQWILAGRLAVQRSAVREAVIHLHHGLELLLDLPPGEDRDRYELALLLALGPALIATRGHTSDDVRDLYQSAQSLVDEVGTPDQHFEVLAGLFTTHFVRSELDQARQFAEELLVVAEVRGDRGSEMAAHVAIGAALLGRGQLREALRHLERGLELYDPARHFALAHGAGQDFGVVALLYAAFCRSALGPLTQAAELAGRGIQLARRLQHPHSLAFALALSSNLFCFLRQPGPALATIRELRSLAEREGFYHWLVEVPGLEGWALIELGHHEQGISCLSGSQAGAMSESDTIRSLTRLRIRAEAYLRAGRAEEAIRTMRSVLNANEQLRSVWWRAEAFRIFGCSLAQDGRPEEAVEQLRRAVEAAEAADTPVYLLRALTDLARSPVSPPERMQIRQQLIAVFRSFAEDADFPDVADAQAVLQPPEPPMDPEFGAV